MGKALSSEPAACRAAQRLVRAERAVVLARGVHYSTAFEIALKLKELTLTRGLDPDRPRGVRKVTETR